MESCKGFLELPVALAFQVRNKMWSQSASVWLEMVTCDSRHAAKEYQLARFCKNLYRIIVIIVPSAKCRDKQLGVFLTCSRSHRTHQKLNQKPTPRSEDFEVVVSCCTLIFLLLFWFYLIFYMSHVVNYRVLSHDLRLHSKRVLKVLAEKR